MCHPGLDRVKLDFKKSLLVSVNSLKLDLKKSILISVNSLYLELKSRCSTVLIKF